MSTLASPDAVNAALLPYPKIVAPREWAKVTRRINPAIGVIIGSSDA
jgi:hypothetical protein